MAASKRFICIHGHFYQPPRENPWLETVETQDTAAPYHDWNERICAECYSTNGAARIVNNKNKITRIVNNYARISFNFGPTLLSWLMENAPRTYRMILDGEQRSRKSYRGHSSAMAQVYNHIILPLASRRDRITQIRWGIADYQHHYGILPEGMWLAETAADNESLELLAQHGIKFTVLAPHQCKRIRPLEGRRGLDRDSQRQRGHHPPLPGPLQLRPLDCRLFLRRPRLASHRLRGAAQLRREPCRAAQGRLQRQRAAATGPCGDGWRIVRPPPQVRRNGAGLCAAPAGRRPDRQADQLRLLSGAVSPRVRSRDRRKHLLELRAWHRALALQLRLQRRQAGLEPGLARAAPPGADELRDALVPLTEQEGAKLFKDVWAARDGYIEAMLDHSPQTVEQFFRKHQLRVLTEPERVRGLELMEMQRHAQLMYTSCGWFFDDISGIETVQIIAYAARVLQLAREAFGELAAPLEPAFLARMAEARSNVATAGDGAKIYKEQVSAKQLGLEQVAAHYAISSIFSSFAEETDLFCFRVWRNSYECTPPAGDGSPWAGSRLSAPSPASSGASPLPSCTLATRTSPPPSRPMSRRTRPPLRPSPPGRGIRAARRLPRSDSPARPLLRPHGLLAHLALHRRAAAHRATHPQHHALRHRELPHRHLQDHASLLHYLSQAGLPKPPALTLAAGFAINAGLRRALEADPSTSPNCAPSSRWPRPTRFRWRRPRSPTSPTSA
jgi:hypothetical protein